MHPTSETHNRSAVCWCGNTDLADFNDDYLMCNACGGTLVARVHPTEAISTVNDDAHDFYGNRYWFEHAEEELGQSNIIMRSRSDLSERVIHWLRALLKYRLPPARVVELGSSHGGFVAAMSWAGYEATGLELSPSIVSLAHGLFGVTTLLGPIEQQSLDANSLDVIVMMDVLEHFPDPVKTIRHCLELLKPDGILLVQTPNIPTDANFTAWTISQDPLLQQLKPIEHVYLFSQTSVTEFLRRLGVEHIAFEPAIFAHYDMFFVASRQPLVTHSIEEIEASLEKQPTGKMIQALMDLDDRQKKLEHDSAESTALFNHLRQQFEASEADREARLQIIQEQGARLSELDQERAQLRQQLDASEADRADRLKVIQEQEEQLSHLEQENANLRQQLDASEADREARLQVIQEQDAQLDQLHRQFEHQRQVLSGIKGTRTYRALRLLGRWDWVEKAPVSPVAKRTNSLTRYQAEQAALIAKHPSPEMISEIRAYNHYMVDTLNDLYPLYNKLMLDVGASPHGFALERAVELGACYVGVGLDVMPEDSTHVLPGSYLFNMDAHKLQLPSSAFDCALCISAFEHITDPAVALSELARVLKSGGCVLISFDTLWSSSTGHHLIHYGDLQGIVPPYAHLFWTATQMREQLSKHWLDDLPISLDEAIEHVYVDPYLNRLDIRYFKTLFQQSSFQVVWLVELKDDTTTPEIIQEAARKTGYTSDELRTRGISVFLRKP